MQTEHVQSTPRNCIRVPLLQGPGLNGIRHFTELHNHMGEFVSKIQRRFTEFDEYETWLKFLEYFWRSTPGWIRSIIKYTLVCKKACQSFGPAAADHNHQISFILLQRHVNPSPCPVHWPAQGPWLELKPGATLSNTEQDSDLSPALTEQIPHFFENNWDQLSKLNDEIQSTATLTSERFIKGKVFRLFWQY